MTKPTESHQKSHTGEKPYSCECSEKTSKKHHENTHTGEKPFSCEKCENKFRHEKQDVKPNTSKQCDKNKKTHTEDKSAENVLSWNIGRGLLKKLPLIEELLEEHNVKIAFVSEVDQDSNLATITIPGYQTVIALPKKNDKVRIMAFVSSNLEIKYMNHDADCKTRISRLESNCFL